MSAKTLRFRIRTPSSMSLRLGAAGLGGPYDSLESSLAFTIAPQTYQQNIFLVNAKPDGGETNYKDWRRLTEEIEGSIRFFGDMPRSISGEEVSAGRIGTLTHLPAFSSLGHGHAESYGIEIYLSSENFKQIQDLFVRGMPPLGITIWTPDVEFGLDPDAWDKVWKLSAEGSTNANVVGFSLGFSTDLPHVVIGPRKSDTEMDDETEKTTEVKQAIVEARQDIHLLYLGVEDVKSSLAQLCKQLTNLMLVALLIAVILAVRVMF